MTLTILVWAFIEEASDAWARIEEDAVSTQDLCGLLGLVAHTP